MLILEGSEYLSKGYSNDAGIDVLLSEQVILKAKTTTRIPTKVKIQWLQGEFGMLLPRTSAALKGLYVASSPIDSDYNDYFSIVVTNLNDYDLAINEGEAICQVVTFVSGPQPYTNIRKTGRRTDSAFGGTGCK